MGIMHVAKLLCISIFLRLFTCCASEPTPQQIDDFYQKHKEVIDRATNQQTIDAFITKGDAAAERYTNPQYLEPFVDPEGHRQKLQRAFNSTLSWTLPTIGTTQFGIYRADIMRTVHLTTAWGIEWWFHRALTAALVDMYTVQLLQAQLQPPPEAAGIKALIVPEYNKKILTLLFGYALSIVLLKCIKEHYLIFEPLTHSPDQPQSVSEIIPPVVMNFVMMCASPQSLTEIINHFFRKFGLIPEWTSDWKITLTQECIAVFLWYRSYEKNTVQPRVRLMVKKHSQTLQNLQAQLKDSQDHTDEHLIVRQLVSDAVHTPFTECFMEKTWKLALWHSVLNVLVATPAWIKIANFVWNLYKELQ